MFKDDHDTKYDVSAEQLDEANAKMSGEKIEEVPTKQHRTVEHDGVKMHYRTEADYQNIWDSFLMNAAEEFKEEMKYSVEDIEKIGIKKFIDAYDWRNATDVMSFKTDKFHIIPCIHCDNEFAVFEEAHGLCKACAELYDLELLDQVISGVAQDMHNTSGEAAAYIAYTAAKLEFVVDPEMRKKFLKKK